MAVEKNSYVQEQMAITDFAPFFPEKGEVVLAKASAQNTVPEDRADEYLFPQITQIKPTQIHAE